VGVRQAIEEVALDWPAAPYHPELNPIEQAVAL
jgi:hypothetical protein